MSLQPKCASESVHPLPSESMSGICVYPIQGNYPTICASAAGTGDDWKVSVWSSTVCKHDNHQSTKHARTSELHISGVLPIMLERDQTRAVGRWARRRVPRQLDVSLAPAQTGTRAQAYFPIELILGRRPDRHM